jgi:pSer/pThr/pTyr-binding forkhead associated (FHA) protein
MSQCPNCGSPTIAQAAFCGQCGFNLNMNAALDFVASGNARNAVGDQTALASNAATFRNATLANNANPNANSNPTIGSTRLQSKPANLFHIQLEQSVELPVGVTIIHLGKANDRIPPDIDLSGYPNSEIVSRIHADIRVEGDTYFIEDVGSSNGTYVNNSPLPVGSRHRLRPGDRIALGKGDKVSFLFQQ